MVLRNWLLGFVNHYDNDSLISRIRRKRMHYFRELLHSLPDNGKGKLSILDIGGDPIFWTNVGLDSERYDLTLVNLGHRTPNSANMSCIVGDATDLSMINPELVDVVFSNSVIEHVGDFSRQKKMAEEMFSMDAPIFLQTPNYWFPMEPHFVFPFFQFLPIWVRTWLMTRFNLGGYDRIPDWDTAREHVFQIQLLSRRQLSRLFPGSKIKRERLFGLTSGFIVTWGWSGKKEDPSGNSR